jgi:hypothetical protein
VIALGASLMPIAALAQQGSNDLAVGVRTQLDRQRKIWDGTHLHRLENAPEHGKVYAILMIQPTKSKVKLMKPVNAAAIRDELVRQLEAHDYHHVQPNQKPDILISVIYGRSWLPNPYYTDKIDVDNMGPEDEPFLADPSNPATVGPTGVVVDNPNLAARISLPSVKYKVTKATFEKLFILVRAFKYPPPADPKKKPEVLWVTTMFVDDPDHLDLNVVCKQMLEAGAPYFDREIKDEEVEIWKPLPEGHVKVGAPEVVAPAKSSGK